MLVYKIHLHVQIHVQILIQMVHLKKQIQMVQIEHLKNLVHLFKIYSKDIFNNINEHNNKIQLVENNSKIKIVIPQGNYTIQELISIIEKLINEKSVFKSYKILYDKNKNRVQISNEKSYLNDYQ